MDPGGVIPDRSHVLTEQRNPRTMRLHEMSVSEIVETIQREDRAVMEAMERARPALTGFLQAAEGRWVGGGRLIYVGAGTSGRLGVLDASECPPTFCTPPERVVGIIAGGDAALRKSSEGKEDDAKGAAAELELLTLTGNDIVVGIAAGGTTPYVLGALEWVKTRGGGSEGGAHEVSAGASVGLEPGARDPRPVAAPLTALITCSPPAPAAAAHADHVIFLDTGPEVVTGSTRMKAGTATKLALNTISTTLMIREGRVYENLMVDVRATNAKLRDRAARIVSTVTGLSREEALGLLDRAGGSVKVAVVMARRKITRDDAERLLQSSRGLP